jgi:hypothetical protein
MIINITDEHNEVLTGFLGEALANAELADYQREAFENLYTQLTSENAELSYFAKDGNYGNATELVVVNTEKWTGEEWAIIEENADHDKAEVALQIDKMINSGEWAER